MQTPESVTVTDGVPVAVLNVQLPLPGLVEEESSIAVIVASVTPGGFGLAPVTPGPEVIPGIGGPPVQLPTSSTPETGVPSLCSSVSVTDPPEPLSAEGDARRTRLPLAVIFAVAVAPPAVKVRVALSLLVRPLVLTAVITQPLESVACAVLPAVLTESTEPDPIPRLAKLKPNTTPANGLTAAS